MGKARGLAEAQEIGRDPARARARGHARGGGPSSGSAATSNSRASTSSTSRRAAPSGLPRRVSTMVTEALDGLAARGVRSCAGADLEAMHETSFRVVPIKELSVVGPAGDTRCTNLAIPLGDRRVHRPRSRIRAATSRSRSSGSATLPTVWCVSAAMPGDGSSARRADAHRHHAAANVVERRAARDRPEAGRRRTASFSARGRPRVPSPADAGRDAHRARAIPAVRDGRHHGDRPGARDGRASRSRRHGGARDRRDRADHPAVGVRRLRVDPTIRCPRCGRRSATASSFPIISRSWT